MAAAAVAGRRGGGRPYLGPTKFRLLAGSEKRTTTTAPSGASGRPPPFRFGLPWVPPLQQQKQKAKQTKTKAKAVPASNSLGAAPGATAPAAAGPSRKPCSERGLFIRWAPPLLLQKQTSAQKKKSEKKKAASASKSFGAASGAAVSAAVPPRKPLFSSHKPPRWKPAAFAASPRSSQPRVQRALASKTTRPPRPLARKAKTSELLPDLKKVFDASVSEREHLIVHERERALAFAERRAAVLAQRRLKSKNKGGRPCGGEAPFCIRCDAQRRWPSYSAPTAAGKQTAGWLGAGRWPHHWFVGPRVHPLF